MQRVRSLAMRVILQMLADRRTLALIVVVPIILLTVAGILIRVEPAQIRVAVVNEDEGVNQIQLGERLIGVLQSMDTFETLTLSAAEARHRIDQGEVDAVITLPPDFTRQVMQNRTLVLPVEFEGSNPTIAERLRSMFERASTQALTSLAVLPAGGGNTAPELTTTLDATYRHGGAEYDTLDFMAPPLIGVFVFLFVFILTSISFLRERLAGTLERLQATPIRSHEIIIGYMLGFLLFGLLQGAITLLYTVYVLNIHYAGNLLSVFLVEALLVVASVNLGIFFSTFARNEFQVLQFIPLVVVSQVFLGGAFWAVEDMPQWLQPLAYLMPLTHANEALRAIMVNGVGLGAVWESLLALVAIGLVVILLASRTAGRVRIG